MADRVVKVRLVADTSEYTAGLVRAAAATRQLGGDVERSIDRDVTPVMKRAGEKSGGLLAQGFRTGFVRNSPLIAAGIGAALAAGAPVALAGAAVLFGGIGALAAAQNSEVRESWTQLGHEIRDGAVEDAAVLVPVYERMAEKIGAAFERMRPEIRDAFEAAAPLIDDFTDSLTQAAENALPGLVRAVERGGPVIEGLGDLMEDIGTGISDFFDAMSDNSGAAGAALSAIGDILAAALPLLGELLGTGAEVAATVLPALAAAFEAVHGALQLVAPILPTVLTGFLAFRVVSSLGGLLDSFSGRLARVATNAGAMTPALNGARTAVSGLSTALPLIGAGLAAWSVRSAAIAADLNKFRAAADEAFAGLNAGGREAEMAAAKLAFLEEVAANGPDNFLGLGADLSGELEQARAAAADAEESMSDLDRAERDVAAAAADLEAVLSTHAPTSDEARAAADALAAAQRNLADAQGDLQLATDGVNQAMLDQADIVAAAANSDLAYRQSVDATQEAVAGLVAAQAEFGTGSEEASDAALQVEAALLRQAEAAAQAAFDTSTATTEAGRNAAADAAMLAELLTLQSTMGSSFPAALSTTITRLQGTTNAGMVAAAQFDQLKLNVLAVPNSKTIIVSSTTPEQIRLLEELGFKVETLPDGTVQVTAQTAGAEAAISSLTRTRYATVVVTTSYSQGYATISGNRTAAVNATGGIVHAFAGGGFERMQGGIAKIVPPNTLRIIGDRVRDDEAYIPINSDARSHDILRATAERMGYNLGREFSGVGSSVNNSSTVTNSPQYNNYVTAGPTARDIVRAMEAAQRQRDALAPPTGWR